MVKEGGAHTIKPSLGAVEGRRENSSQHGKEKIVMIKKNDGSSGGIIQVIGKQCF